MYTLGTACMKLPKACTCLFNLLVLPPMRLCKLVEGSIGLSGLMQACQDWKKTCIGKNHAGCPTQANPVSQHTFRGCSDSAVSNVIVLERLEARSMS